MIHTIDVDILHTLTQIYIYIYYTLTHMHTYIITTVYDQRSYPDAMAVTFANLHKVGNDVFYG